MKPGNSSRNIRLGAFLVSGTLILIIGLYLIGDKQNLFGGTFRLVAAFSDVSGLRPGNNVRFAGVDVGTVEEVSVAGDSLVHVTMVIDKEVMEYIKKNAVASIQTDGLLGNKLIRISPSTPEADHVQDGDKLVAERPNDIDDIIRALTASSDNIQAITGNLRTVTNELNAEGTVLSLLGDKQVADNLRISIVNIRDITSGSAMITGDLQHLVENISSGEGSFGALLTDTTLTGRISRTVVNLEKISDTAAVITGDMTVFMKKVNGGEGSIGLLLNDTSLVNDVVTGIENIKDGAKNFNENMEALKLVWPFRKFYKKKAAPK